MQYVPFDNYFNWQVFTTVPTIKVIANVSACVCLLQYAERILTNVPLYFDAHDMSTLRKKLAARLLDESGKCSVAYI